MHMKRLEFTRSANVVQFGRNFSHSNHNYSTTLKNMKLNHWPLTAGRVVTYGTVRRDAYPLTYLLYLLTQAPKTVRGLVPG